MSIIDDFISLFFPHQCFSCSRTMVKGEDILCTSCILNLPKSNYAVEDSLIIEKLAGRLPLVHGFAFLKFNKGGSVQHLLHKLKYEGHPEIGIKLGEIFGKELKDKGFYNQFDVIIPVPLHRSRLRKRGYNQSAKFAEGLSQALGIQWSDSIFIRIISTPTQTNKSVLERWENVKDAFSITNKKQIRKKRVLLVDDIITTGATLEACGEHLVRGGCDQISIACIAEAQ